MSSKSGWSLMSRARAGALAASPAVAGAGAARPFVTRLLVLAAAVFFTEVAVLDALATVAARLRTAGTAAGAVPDAVAGAAEEASFDTALRRGRALRADPGDVTLNSS